MTRQAALFIYSNGNILGSLLALLGLGLFFIGLIKSFWIIIVIGLYVIGYLLAPKNRTITISINQHLSVEEIRKGLKDLSKAIRKRVSPPVLSRVESITETINTLLTQLNKIEANHHNLHIIKQTATDYLPEMLNTYLSLPTAFARFHIIKNKQTPRDILLEQLDLLDAEMKQILLDIHQQDTEALLTHGRFLKDKFSKGQDWLN